MDKLTKYLMLGAALTISLIVGYVIYQSLKPKDNRVYTPNPNIREYEDYIGDHRV